MDLWLIIVLWYLSGAMGFAITFYRSGELTRGEAFVGVIFSMMGLFVFLVVILELLLGLILKKNKVIWRRK